MTELIVKQEPGFTEIGSAGLTQSAGTVSEEFLSALQGSQAVKVFTEMSENDAVVSAMLFAIEMFVRKLPWSFEPATDDDRDREAAKFGDENIHDMSSSWQMFLSECVTFLPFGWSWFEVIWKKRLGLEQDPKSKFDDGAIGWRKLAPRPQSTLLRWEFDDNGGIKALVQLAPPSFEPTTIPIEKSLLFRLTARKNNPEGRSILRGAYRGWSIKKRLENYEAIGIERNLSGLPKATLPAEWMGPSATDDQKLAVKNMKEIVMGVRRDELGGLVIPALYDTEGHRLIDFELLSAPGKRDVEVDRAIQRWDQRITQSLLEDFIVIGHSSVGSFALAESKQAFFGKAVAAIADSIQDTIQDHAVPDLFAFNQQFGTENGLPRLRHGKVEPPSLRDLGNFLLRMATAGFDLTQDIAVENFLRRQAQMPERSITADVAGAPTGTPAENGGPPRTQAVNRRWNMMIANELNDGLEMLNDALERIGSAPTG